MSKFLLGGNSYGNKSYTLNFDGSHNNQSQTAGAGCVIRDDQGNLIVAASYCLTNTYPDCNVAIAEAVALQNGLKLAKTRQIKLNLIKGDSKEVIDHVVGRTLKAPKPPLSAIIEEIQTALYEQGISPLSKVELISREANRVADKLALSGSRLIGRDVIYQFEDELPPQVVELLGQEKSPGGGSSSGGGGSSSSSMADAIGVAGAAIAGIAMLGWGISKLFSDGDQNKTNKSPLTTRDWFNTVPNSPNNHGFYTLNVDGLDSNQLEKAAAGCIIRDKQGDLVVAAAYNLDNCYPDCHIGIAEAIALKKGLELADKHNIKLNVVEGDNEEVINRVLGRERRPPKVAKLSEIIQEIKNALDPETQLKLIPSEANKTADKLALYGRRILRDKTYARGDHDIPFEVSAQIQVDKLSAIFKY